MAWLCFTTSKASFPIACTGSLDRVWHDGDAAARTCMGAASAAWLHAQNRVVIGSKGSTSSGGTTIRLKPASSRLGGVALW